MRITIVLALLVLSAGIYLASCNTVLAQENNIGQSKIHPAHPLYFLKGVREILELKFAATDRIKSIRKLEFATRRIREVKALASDNKEELIGPTLERYGAILKDIIGTTNITDKESATQLGEAIDKHLQALYLVYQNVKNPRAKMSIRLAVYRLVELNTEFIKRLVSSKEMVDFANLRRARQINACEFLGKEASSSALNEVERGVYKDRAESCFKSLRHL